MIAAGVELTGGRLAVELGGAARDDDDRPGRGLLDSLGGGLLGRGQGCGELGPPALDVGARDRDVRAVAEAVGEGLRGARAGLGGDMCDVLGQGPVDPCGVSGEGLPGVEGADHAAGVLAIVEVRAGVDPHVGEGGAHLRVAAVRLPTNVDGADGEDHAAVAVAGARAGAVRGEVFDVHAGDDDAGAGSDALDAVPQLGLDVLGDRFGGGLLDGGRGSDGGGRGLLELQRHDGLAVADQGLGLRLLAGDGGGDVVAARGADPAALVAGVGDRADGVQVGVAAGGDALVPLAAVAAGADREASQEVGLDAVVCRGRGDPPGAALGGLVGDLAVPGGAVGVVPGDPGTAVVGLRGEGLAGGAGHLVPPVVRYCRTRTE
ncbi:hypothetical protein [Streptomyces collinus]